MRRFGAAIDEHAAKVLKDGLVLATVDAPLGGGASARCQADLGYRAFHEVLWQRMGWSAERASPGLLTAIGSVSTCTVEVRSRQLTSTGFVQAQVNSYGQGPGQSRLSSVYAAVV